MNKLVVGNLVHRPLRSIISALAVAIEVVMILSIVGIFYGILNGYRTQTTGIGMDMLTHPGSATAILTTTAAAAPIQVADILRKLPYVEVVSPVNLKLSTSGGIENISGIDYESYNALRPFVFVAGTPFQQPYDVLIDDMEASKGFKVGDTIKVLNHSFRICGIVQSGKGGKKYIPLATMDEIDGNPGKAAVFYLKTKDTPAHWDDVRKEILATDGLGQYDVQTSEEFLSSLAPDRMPGFNIALHVVISIAVIIGFMVIFQSMYTAVMERTREIGILKSMGAGKLAIVSVVLRETGLLAVVGIALGVGATYLLRWFLHARVNPTLSFQITTDWVWKAVGIALAGSLLGASYPALKAAQKDPIDALSYE